MTIGQREGQCDACRICWIWTRNTRLQDQTCRRCGHKLRRVTKAGRDKTAEGGPYNWITWEGYTP